MIEVTDLALEVLDEALKAGEVANDEGLCIRRRNGILTLDLEKPSPDDKVVSRNGRVIYMVDPKDEVRIGRGYVDVCDTDDGAQLVFRQAGRMDGKERVNHINNPLLVKTRVRDSQDCFGCGLDGGKRD